MKALSVFRPRIAPSVYGCLEEVIDRAVLDTAIDFCERSMILKRMAASFATVASQLEYTLPVTADTSISTIMRMWCGDQELTPFNEDNVGTPFGFVSAITGFSSNKGTPRNFHQTGSGVIAFYPIPDSVYQINIRAAMRPLRSSTQIDDILFEDWVEPIVDGALSRLYLMPGDWASSTLAKFHSERYEVGLNAALSEASKGVARAQLRVTPVHV